MLPGTGYFKTLPCPFFDMGLCERPFCHFKHIKPDDRAGVEPEPGQPDPSAWDTGGAGSGVSGESTHPGYKTSTEREEVPLPSLSIAASASGATTTHGETSSNMISTPSIATGLEPDKLETLIEQAIRKVLQEKLGPQEPVIPANPKVKEEVDDDDDDIIVEYCAVNPPPSHPLKQETVAVESRSSSSGWTGGLCLPPPGTPAYTPTPIAVLKKRKSNEETASAGLSSGLMAASSLVTNQSSVAKPKQTKGKTTFTFSYEPATVEPARHLLGDTEDISDSEEEQQGDETPDLLGSILKEGNATGVLSGGVSSNFEEQIIKEKWRSLKKKLDKDKSGDEPVDADKADKDEAQCHKISSSQGPQQQQEPSTEAPPVEEKVETEAQKEARLLHEEEEEIRKLEEKRKILENYYNKSKMKKKTESNTDNKKQSSEPKDKVSEMKSSFSKSKAAKSSDVSDRHSSSKHRSRDSSSRHRSSRDSKHRKDTQSSRHRSSHKSKSSKSSKHRRSHKDSKKHHRHRDDSTSEESDYTEETSDSESSHRHRHKGRRRSKKRRHDSSSSSLSEEEESSQSSDLSTSQELSSDADEEESSEQSDGRRASKHSSKRDKPGNKSDKSKNKRDSSKSEIKISKNRNPSSSTKDTKLTDKQSESITGTGTKKSGTDSNQKVVTDEGDMEYTELSEPAHTDPKWGLEVSLKTNGNPLDEFQKAELRIKELLQNKIKESSYGIYGSFKAPPPPPVQSESIQPQSQKIIPPKSRPENAPTKKEMETPKIEGGDEAAAVSRNDGASSPPKLELKLRSLSELVANDIVDVDKLMETSTSIADSGGMAATEMGILDDGETFDDMVRRHTSTSWQTAGSAEPSQVVEEEDEDEIDNSQQTSFLDAISAPDKSKSKKHHTKEDKSKRSSDSRTRSKDKSLSRDKKDHKSAKSSKSREEKKKDEKRKRPRSRERESSKKQHKDSKDSKSRRSKDHKRRRKEEDDTEEERAQDSQHYDQYSGGDSSPVPDLTEELSMLPDELMQDSLEAGMDAIFGGLEDDNELQRVFQDYRAEAHAAPDPAKSKSKSQEKVTSSGSASSSSSRKRVAHEQAKEAVAAKRPLHFRKPALKTPQQAMLARIEKVRRMAADKKGEEEGDQAKADADTTSQPGPSGLASEGGRKAHQPKIGNAPVVLSKTKQQLASRNSQPAAATSTSPSPGTSKQDMSTIAQTSKGRERVAHTPSNVVLAKPVVAGPTNAKVPNHIRQRYLDTMVEECLKIYAGDQTVAYPRAEKEEQDCCRKASSRMIYLNLVVNKIKRLRTEAKEAAERVSRPSLTTGGVGQGKRSLLTTHMQVLAGRPGTVGTWSIEKPVRLTDQDIDEDMLYGIMRNFVLSEELLVENGFPRPDPQELGKAVVKIDTTRAPKITISDPDKRVCDRCKTIYRVDKFGVQVDKQECIYHWGRTFRKRGDRTTGMLSVFYCCSQSSDSSGCQVGKVHVTDVLDYNDMRGFVSTMERVGQEGRVFALDCEMCNTTQGNELTRVTVIDHTGEVCYESLVKPHNPIIDYNTRFSGIKAEDLEGVNTSILQVQAALLNKFAARDILIGHSLESDLKALKMLHSTVVDTSVVFPHKMGPPYKRALKFLAADHLKRIIQQDEGGHDSKEDALACLDLMKFKVKEEVKKLQKKARLQAAAK